MALGRPTKYNKEILIKTQEYIENYETYGDAIPSIAGLSCILGVRRETIHVWSHEEGKEYFSNILGELLSKQERVLFNKGLSGEFNSNICKLALGKHGFHDKVDSEVSGPGGKPLDMTWTVNVVSPERQEK